LIDRDLAKDFGRAVATIEAFQKEVAEQKVSEQLQGLSKALTQAAAAPSTAADEAFSADYKLSVVDETLAPCR
jgi:hypothetical protein